MSVKILWDDSVAAYRVATPYNPNFVETLKKLIPISDRVWDPQQKIWTVASQYATPIKTLCESIWGVGSVTFVSQQDAANIAQKRAAAAAAFHAQQQAQQFAQAAAPQYHYVPPKTPPPRGAPLEEVLVAFLKVLPYEAAKTAYRNAALLLHPDKNGGDGSRMSVLNAAWSRIEKELYSK